MKIGIVGAGGVGGYFGARLLEAGHDVRFVARGAHAEAMQSAGLQIRSERGDALLRPVAVFTDSRQVGAVDLVVVAVKLWDTESAARAVLPMLGPTTSVVSLQNGIEKDEAIAAVVGRAHVLGGVTYIVATLDGPGVIVHAGKLQRVVIGELAGGTSPRVTAIVEALRSAGLEAEASTDIRRTTWEKLVFLASMSAVTAATRGTIGAVRTHAATRALLRDALEEGVAVARAEGVLIADDFVADRLRFLDTLPAQGRSSMAQDLLRGHRLELEWLSGAVVRRGARLGVPTPVHRALYAALALFADGAPS